MLLLLSCVLVGQSSSFIVPPKATGYPVVHLDQSSPIPEKLRQDHVRMVVLSDTHGRHRELPDLPGGDILLHLGDVANQGSLEDIRSFVHWMSNTQQRRFKEIVLVGGNHDRDRLNPEAIQLKEEYKDFIYLHDETYSLANDKLVVYGASWDSCEKDKFSMDNNSASRRKIFENNRKAENIDIFLTHKNPYLNGIFDHGWDGSKEISRILKDQHIPLHLFGHVHWGRGIKQMPPSSELEIHNNYDNTIMVNCASAWNQPVVIDWDPLIRKPVMIHCPIPNSKRKEIAKLNRKLLSY